MDRLRLLAVDSDDLAILSAHCQDAVVKMSDLRFLPREKQFVLEMNRFVWEGAVGGSLWSRLRRREYERRRAVLHFDRVLGARRLGLAAASEDQVLVLLAIRFTPKEEPSGVIELVFAGGSAIRLDVEVVEAQLADVGGAWSTESRPDHEGPER
ncbi:DUF2948 family protein [Aurantimonas sp. VKM B-3413]|uniref:DUF2948 family protein n=1 Tax=Aurantimonas sp. VKM B-3413 TaxID=2779401 RepID=UPI001E3EA811|nr:DUF2948 family protein [Aurantimonas sp. VKM B-3413]MCB8839592.1 DUF2948 family protein [Aurantimonas sp. VKM B-3413]